MAEPPRCALQDARVEVSASRVAFSTGESLSLGEAVEEEESLLDLWISCCSGAGGIVLSIAFVCVDLKLCRFVGRTNYEICQEGKRGRWMLITPILCYERALVGLLL